MVPTDLTIIIPSYNTKKLLERCLISVFLSLERSKLKVAVVVIDNNSSDGSQELLREKFPKVHAILKNENLGYGKANNEAIQQGTGTILLLNSDCVVHEKAIETLYFFIKNHPHSFVGGRLLNEDLTIQKSCGPFYTLPIVFCMLFLKGDQLGITRVSPNMETKADWVSGACLMGEKSSFLDVGLFDESIFMYMEEIDFLYRARSKKYDVWFYPDATFTHTGAASSGSKKEPVVQIFRGLDYFYKKHHSPVEHGILRFLLRLKAWLAIIIYVIIGNSEMKKLYAKAIRTLS